MINQWTKGDKLRGRTGWINVQEDGKEDGLWINGVAACSVRLEIGMCPVHEQCKGVASQQRHFTAFYLYWLPSEVCLGIRDSHWARKKDQLLSSEGQEILSDESCLLRKRDRNRGLAVHCLLERKNWKCVIKREENIKIPETEKLWLGGPMCKKKIEQKTDWWGQCCQRDYYLRQWNFILYLFRAAVLQTGASDTKISQAWELYSQPAPS